MQQRPDQLPIQATCRPVVDVFHAGRAEQSPFFQAPGQGPVLPPVPLLIDQQRQAFFERKLTILRVLLLLCEAVRHTAQAQSM